MDQALFNRVTAYWDNTCRRKRNRIWRVPFLSSLRRLRS